MCAQILAVAGLPENHPELESPELQSPDILSFQANIALNK